MTWQKDDCWINELAGLPRVYLERDHLTGDWYGEYQVCPEKPGAQPKRRSLDSRMKAGATIKSEYAVLSFVDWVDEQLASDPLRPRTWRGRLGMLIDERAREFIRSPGAWPALRAALLTVPGEGCIGEPAKAHVDQLTIWVHSQLNKLGTVCLLRERVGKRTDPPTFQDAARRVVEELPGVPQIDALRLPPAPDQRKRLVRDVSGVQFEQYAHSAKLLLGQAHDGVLHVFQAILDNLAGRACPELTENQAMAREVQSMADAFGVSLFTRARNGEVTQVRVTATPAPPSRTPDMPASRAGTFLLKRTGRAQGSVSLTALFPALVAARTVEQATAKLAQHDTPADGE